MKDNAAGNPFDPAINPTIEYVPYDEDAGLAHIMSQDTQFGRDIKQRVGVWLDARYQIKHQSGGEAGRDSLMRAESNLRDYLAEAGITRIIREKKQEPEE